MTTSSRRKQRGFSMAELTAYLAIATILSVLAIAAIKIYIISGRVPTFATELQNGAQRLRINGEGQGATPYASLTTDEVCNLMRGGSVVSTTGVGAGATCTHSVRALGSGGIVATPGTLAAVGDSWVIEVDNVSNFACPDLGATMQKASEIVTINGNVVKPAGGNYDAAAATAACTLLDTNTFVFQGV
jgi:Tfp pilus assembly protein FimT